MVYSIPIVPVSEVASCEMDVAVVELLYLVYCWCNSKVTSISTGIV